MVQMCLMNQLQAVALNEGPALQEEIAGGSGPRATGGVSVSPVGGWNTFSRLIDHPMRDLTTLRFCNTYDKGHYQFTCRSVP